MKITKKHMVFFTKFAVIFTALELIILNMDLSVFQQFIASTQANFFGLEYSENFIFVKDGTFKIVNSCIGVVSGSVLASIVFSLKKPGLKEKILVFLGGLIALVVINYFRVLFVVWSGMEFGIKTAEILHVITWLSTAIFIIALWFVFTKKITGVKSFSGFL